MRMQSETAGLAAAGVQEVEEDERFDQFTHVVWASEPRNHAMRAAGGAMDVSFQDPERGRSRQISSARVRLAVG
jgi:hypothetical protein